MKNSSRNKDDHALLQILFELDLTKASRHITISIFVNLRLQNWTQRRH